MDRFTAANEVELRVGFSGHSGHLKLEPLPPVERSNPLTSITDFILPPATPPETLEETYLETRLDPDEFSVENYGRQWDFDWFDRAKVPMGPSAPRSVVVPSWELRFGLRITRFRRGFGIPLQLRATRRSPRFWYDAKDAWTSK